MRKTEPFHNLRSGKHIIAENGEQTVNRGFILVGYLVAILVGGATNNSDLFQTVSDDFKHQFNKSCAVYLLVSRVESIVVFFLPGLDQFLNRKPKEQFFPLTEEEAVPHSSHASVAVCEWMNEFKLIVENSTLDQWMKL